MVQISLKEQEGEENWLINYFRTSQGAGDSPVWDAGRKAAYLPGPPRSG